MDGEQLGASVSVRSEIGDGYYALLKADGHLRVRSEEPEGSRAEALPHRADG